MGHTKVRCKEPLVDEDAGGDNGNNGEDINNYAGGGFDNYVDGGHDDFASAPVGGDGW